MSPKSGLLKGFDFLRRVPVCPVNIQHVVMRSERYDTYACLECNKWLKESKCSDPTCEFCKDRPEKPRGE